MQLAAHNASKENQVKDKRIHQLEKKVIQTLNLFHTHDFMLTQI